MDKPWWYPEKTDRKWLRRIRANYPNETKDMSDESIRDRYADGRKYAVQWDHLGDAYTEYEALADAFFKKVQP